MVCLHYLNYLMLLYLEILFIFLLHNIIIYYIAVAENIVLHIFNILYYVKCH